MQDGSSMKAQEQCMLAVLGLTIKEVEKELHTSFKRQR